MDKGRSRSAPLGNHVAAALSMYLDVIDGRVRLCQNQNEAHSEGNYRDAPSFNPEVSSFASDPVAHQVMDKEITDEIKISRIIDGVDEGLSALVSQPKTDVDYVSPKAHGFMQQPEAKPVDDSLADVNDDSLINDWDEPSIVFHDFSATNSKVEPYHGREESRLPDDVDTMKNKVEPISQPRRQPSSVGRNSLFDIAESDGGMTDQY